jgi:hypothetical protein
VDDTFENRAVMSEKSWRVKSISEMLVFLQHSRAPGSMKGRLYKPGQANGMRWG